MLHLHHADELPPLLAALGDVLRVPPTDPFTPDVVVVPTAGLRDAAMAGLGRLLGRSATNGSSSGDGVVANVDWVFPGEFVTRALGIVASDDHPDPWSIDRLTWAVLEELEDGSVSVPRPASGSQWALARRIADLFDRYATQRPRVIEAWSRGIPTDGTVSEHSALPDRFTELDHHHVWQFHLWREVRARIGEPSPPERLPALLAGLRDGSVQPVLPDRVCLFGLASVPPATLTVLASLSQTRDVHLFLRHHSNTGWTSVPTDLAGGLQVRGPSALATTSANRLGESWGRPSLEAAALLNGLPDLQRHALSRPVEAPTTLLQALQAAIRSDRRPAPVDGVLDDGSVRVHACHGDLRQLEALRDALGHAFVDDPTLEPHEVLVLCPDLDRFAPLVEAVLGRGGLPVPVRVSDRSITTDQPLVVALQSAVAVASGRASLSDVLALAELEPVRRRFGWSPSDVEQMATWAATLGVRWGLTTDLRCAWSATDQYGDDWTGLPSDLTEGTWQSVARRLLAGITMQAPVQRAALGGVVPHDDLGTDDVRLVGGLADLLERLVRLHDRLEGEHPVADWVEVLLDALDDLAAVDRKEAWQRAQVRRALRSIVDAFHVGGSPVDGDGCDVPLALIDVQAMLQHVLTDIAGRLSLRSGSVTVTSMIPMHGVPARVVCVLGLDSGSIRSGSFDGDDVLGLRPCVGERHPRAEGRQLLLDAVLAAGERLVITCSGADLTTNKKVPLDVPLVELLSELGSIVPLDRDGLPVVVRHRRHGFHEVALRPDELVPVSGRPFTFDGGMLEAALAKREAEAARKAVDDQLPTDEAPQPTSPWALGAQPLVPSGSVPLDRLVDAVVNPARVYLRDRLDIRLPGESEQPDDNFAVTLDPLHRSSLGRDLLDARRAGASYEQWIEAARLSGTLPPGNLAVESLQAVVDELTALESVIAAWGIDLTAATELPITVDLDVVDSEGTSTTEHSLRIDGVVGGITRDGPDADRAVMADIRFARPKPSHELALAVRLAALQVHAPDIDWTAVLITRAESSRGKLETTQHGIRVRGSGEERQQAARDVLTMASQLALWAFRDAVPLFDRSSRLVDRVDADAAFDELAKDLADQWVAILWSGQTPRELLDAPVAALDPTLLADHEPSTWAEVDHGFADGSRLAAVARWVWGTVRSSVVVVDANGQVVDQQSDEGQHDEGASE